MGRIMLPGVKVSWNQTQSGGTMWEAWDRSHKGTMVSFIEFLPCKLENTDLNLKLALAFKKGLK